MVYGISKWLVWSYLIMTKTASIRLGNYRYNKSFTVARGSLSHSSSTTVSMSLCDAGGGKRYPTCSSKRAQKFIKPKSLLCVLVHSHADTRHLLGTMFEPKCTWSSRMVW